VLKASFVTGVLQTVLNTPCGNMTAAISRDTTE
jgi:hypothetical protein